MKSSPTMHPASASLSNLDHVLTCGFLDHVVLRIRSPFAREGLHGLVVVQRAEVGFRLLRGQVLVGWFAKHLLVVLLLGKVELTDVVDADPLVEAELLRLAHFELVQLVESMLTEE